MNKFFTIISMALILNSCHSQPNKNQINKWVGGPCEGCEAIYEYGDKILNAIDTLPGFLENEPKIKVTGTVFRKDGKTPAENVILYIYHTNREGVYEKREDEKGWAKRHGYIRGWVKTGKDGVYTFYTFRPAAYPQGSEPEHIHITVKEPSENEYYMDEFLFEDDPLLTEKEKNSLQKRGGSGITAPELNGDIYLIKRDIILGLNIPDYD